MRKVISSIALVIILVFAFVSCQEILDLLGISDTVDIEAVEIILNDDGTITIRVRNNGDESQTDVKVWILLSTDRKINKNDIHVHTIFVTAGSSLTAT